MNDNAESADSVSFDREALIPAESHSEPTGSNCESSSGFVLDTTNPLLGSPLLIFTSGMMIETSEDSVIGHLSE
jgi:hypothetical protein